MNTKKWICLFLALLLSLPLASCGAEEETPETTVSETTAAADETAGETETELHDGVPADLMFEGENINILYRGAFTDEFTADGEGDIVNQAVYMRNLTVEERLGVTLTYIPNESTDWNGGYQNVILQSVLAGDNSHDIVSGPSYHTPTLILDSAILPLNDVAYLSLDMPWWSQGLIETTSIAGKLFFATGDISLGMLKYIHCIFYNKDLCADHGISELSDVVFEGKWTLDTLNELASIGYVDLNGDGAAVLTDDQFGFIITDQFLMRGLYDSLEMSYFNVGESGSPEFDFGNPRTADAYDKLVTMLHSDDAIRMGNSTTNGNDDVYPVFTSDRALFVTGRFVDCETAYREMESDFGLLPFPKWDEAQKDYKVTICGSESIFGLPINSRNPDMMGAVMEALAFESYKTVSPAYYESALKIKYSREEGDVSSRMVDIIKEGALFNPVVQMSKFIGTDKILMQCIINATPWTSAIASQQKSLEAKLADVISTVEKNYP